MSYLYEFHTGAQNSKMGLTNILSHISLSKEGQLLKSFNKPNSLICLTNHFNELLIPQKCIVNVNAQVLHIVTATKEILSSLYLGKVLILLRDIYKT